MHGDEPDPFVNELLEASLKQYRGEEPRSGLEMRILAGVRSRQGVARRRRLVWALAACAGTLAAIVLVFHSAHAPNRRRVTSASAPHPTAKPPASPGSADSRFRSPRPVHEPKEELRTPKLGVRATNRPEQFPTPLPLTEQEKLLLAYFNKAPKADSIPGADENAPDALEIPRIKIAALEIEPLDDSQFKQEK